MLPANPRRNAVKLSEISADCIERGLASHASSDVEAARHFEVLVFAASYGVTATAGEKTDLTEGGAA